MPACRPAGGDPKLAQLRRDNFTARPEPRTSRRAAGGGGPGRARPGPAGASGGKSSGGSPPDKLAEVARGSTLNLVGAGVAAVTTLGVTVVVTRQFSRPVAGAFFTAISAFLIVEAVASLGANVGLVYFIARLRSLGQAGKVPVMLRAAIIPVMVASAILTAIMLLLAVPLAHLLLSGAIGHGEVGKAAVADALRALALTVPFAALLDTFLGACRGYRDMRATVVVDRIGRSTAQLLGVLVAALAGGAALLAPLWALPYVPAAAVAWLWLRRIRRTPGLGTGSALPDVPPELAALLALSTSVPRRNARANSRIAQRRLANANARGFWRFTAPRGIASLVSITLQRLDIVLVAIMRSPAEAAVYTAATRFLVVGQLGNTAISMAAQPRFTELFATGERRAANTVYQATTSWLVLLNWPLYLLAIVFGPLVLAIFGHSYAAGDAVMVILGVTMLLGSACGQVDMVLITTGRSSWSLANGLLQVCMNVGLDVLLIPKYGITGAAIGWAIAIAIGNVLPLAQLAATTRLHPFGRGTIVACILAGLCFGAVPLLLRAFLGGPAALAATVVGGSALYAAGMWRFRGILRLRAMPGVSTLRARLRRQYA